MEPQIEDHLVELQELVADKIGLGMMKKNRNIEKMVDIRTVNRKMIRMEINKIYTPNQIHMQQQTQTQSAYRVNQTLFIQDKAKIITHISTLNHK